MHSRSQGSCRMRGQTLSPQPTGTPASRAGAKGKRLLNQLIQANKKQCRALSAPTATHMFLSTWCVLHASCHSAERRLVGSPDCCMLVLGQPQKSHWQPLECAGVQLQCLGGLHKVCVDVGHAREQEETHQFLLTRTDTGSLGAPGTCASWSSNSCFRSPAVRLAILL